VEACGAEGIAYVPFMIAWHGAHAGVTGVGHSEVRAVAQAHGASAAQVRLAWALQRGAHVLVIPGTGDPAHLTANPASGALRLADEEMARLGAVHEPV